MPNKLLLYLWGCAWRMTLVDDLGLLVGLQMGWDEWNEWLWMVDMWIEMFVFV